MTNEDTNPRAIIGANKPPVGAPAEGEQTVGEIVATRLKLDYDELDKLVTELLEKARKLPATVDSDEEAVPCTTTMPRRRRCSRPVLRSMATSSC